MITAYSMIYKFLRHTQTQLSNVIEKINRRRVLSFVKNVELVPYIQPVFTNSNMLTGGEVLLRIKQNGHLYSAGSFIGSIEKTDLINVVSCKMIKEVSQKFYHKRKDLPEGFYFSFNITATQLYNDEVIKAVKLFSQEFKGHASIVLEIVERESLNFDDETLEIIEDLISCGVLFAIDDFGSGTSSLRYVEHIGFSIIKLDKALTIASKGKLVYKNVIKSMVSLSHSLNIKLIAEGVENNDQLALLEKAGVDSMQGFHLAKPMDTIDFIKNYIDRCKTINNH